MATQTPASEKYDSEMTVVLAGKSGAGKSTLMNKLLGRNISPTRMDPSAVTAKFINESVINNGTKIHVIDTRGLAEKKSDKKKELKRLSSYTDGKADLLLYCVQVGPGSKFKDHNPVTMRCLTEAFGKQIWDHCVLVFTMSNLALLPFKKSDTAVQDYKTYLDRFANNFEQQLHSEVKLNHNVKTVFHWKLKDASNTIYAVPVGWSEDDEVLPGLDQILSELQPPGTPPSKQSIPITLSWRDILFAVITAKSTPDSQESILKFRYGSVLANKILVGIGAVGGGVVGGAIAGGVIGGVAGIPGGPAAVIAGIIIGSLAGGSAVGTAGGAAAGYGTTKVRELIGDMMTAKEVKKLQDSS